MRRIRYWLAIATLAIILIGHSAITLAQLPPQPGETLPALQPHPLPASLTQWQSDQQGDYFSQITATPAGYLVWSAFPVRVFVQPVAEQDQATDRPQEWLEAVIRAVQEWSAYLPLTLVDDAETANITVWRRSPPLNISRTSGSVLPNGIRARSAETRYELLIDRTHTASLPAVLSHRCEVLLSPGQTLDYVQAAARHELGHALGIWGHSPLSTDALYFSQVRNPPLISPRDISTLKRIYEQPTRLGWSVEPQPTS